jgi:hypothetical protein
VLIGAARFARLDDLDCSGLTQFLDVVGEGAFVGVEVLGEFGHRCLAFGQGNQRLDSQRVANDVSQCDQRG